MMLKLRFQILTLYVIDIKGKVKLTGTQNFRIFGRMSSEICSLLKDLCITRNVSNWVFTPTCSYVRKYLFKDSENLCASQFGFVLNVDKTQDTQFEIDFSVIMSSYRKIIVKRQYFSQITTCTRTTLGFFYFIGFVLVGEI